MFNDIVNHPNANKLEKSYVKTGIDITGSLYLEGDTKLIINKNLSTTGNLKVNNAIFSGDLNCNNKINVVQDVSMNGNVTIEGDISLNGKVINCNLNPESIPKSAFNGTITAAAPNYDNTTFNYDRDIQLNNDVSFNGTTSFDSITAPIIEFSDNTKIDVITPFCNDIDIFNSTSLSQLINNGSLTKVFEYPNTNPNGYTYKTIMSANGRVIIQNRGGINYNNADPYYFYDPTVDLNKYMMSGVHFSNDYGKTFRSFIPKEVDGSGLGVSIGATCASRTGQYILLQSVTGGNNVASKAYCPHISSDYGETWTTVKTYSGDGSSHNYWFKTGSMSPSGKYMVLYNSGQSSPTYIFSNDYGKKWSSSTTSNFGNNINQDVYQLDNGEIIGGNEVFTTVIKYNPINDTSVTFSFTSTDSSLNYIGKVNFGNWNTWSRAADNGNRYGLAHSEDFSVTINRRYIGNYSVVTNNTSDIIDSSTAYRTITILDFSVEGVIIPSERPIHWSTSNYEKGCVFPFDAHISPNGKYIYIFARGKTTSNSDFYVELSSTNYGISFQENNHMIVPSSSHSNMGQSASLSIIRGINNNGSFIINVNGNTQTQVVKSNVIKPSTYTLMTINNNLRAASYSTFSDYRIKENVKLLDKHQTIDNLRPVKYRQTLINKSKYGFIAHELQEHYPDLVVGEKDGDDWQTINYNGLIAILINEIQNLKNELKEILELKKH